MNGGCGPTVRPNPIVSTAGRTTDVDVIPGAFATRNNLASDMVAYGMYDIGRREGTDFVWEYKTLAMLTATDTALTVTRPVQQYITSSFTYKWGWSIGSDGDGYVHVFAKGGTKANGMNDLYAAKVHFDDIEDTSKVRT